jgi:hypothetical protein
VKRIAVGVQAGGDGRDYAPVALKPKEPISARY